MEGGRTNKGDQKVDHVTTSEREKTILRRSRVVIVARKRKLCQWRVPSLVCVFSRGEKRSLSIMSSRGISDCSQQLVSWSSCSLHDFGDVSKRAKVLVSVKNIVFVCVRSEQVDGILENILSVGVVTWDEGVCIDEIHLLLCW